MLKRVLSAQLFAAIICGISCLPASAAAPACTKATPFSIPCLPAPAVALDCTKAKTPVEVAICTDDHLDVLDDMISAQYFFLLRGAKNDGFQRGEVSLHDALQADQRKWLAQRNRACNAKPKDRVIACVKDSLSKRSATLQEIGYPMKGDTLTIGSETVTIGSETVTTGSQTMTVGSENIVKPNQQTLEYHGKVIVEGPVAYLHPFDVVQRWSSPDVDAVLLRVQNGGTLQCSSLYVLAARKSGLDAHQYVYADCIGFETYAAAKTEHGFVWSFPSSPTSDGEITEWDARSGAVSTKKLKFRPESGTTMRDLLAGPKPGEQEPLKNQEFFDAADKLPTAYRKRVMAALWNVAEDCSTCQDNAGRERFGISIEPDLVLYSGCGWDMRPHLDCGADDALGMWERKSGAFFFAVRQHHFDRLPVTDAEVYVQPPLAEWPPVAKQKFELWQKGAKLVERDK